MKLVIVALVFSFIAFAYFKSSYPDWHEQADASGQYVWQKHLPEYKR